jgi:hypothetical protein
VYCEISKSLPHHQEKKAEQSGPDWNSQIDHGGLRLPEVLCRTAISTARD